MQSSCEERLQLCPGTDLLGEGLSWRQAWAGAGLVPPKPSPLSPAAGGQRGLNRPVGIYWGEAVSQAQSVLCLHPHKFLQPRVKTCELHPGAARSLGWPLSSSIPSPPLPKALQSKGCGPVLPITPLGFCVQGFLPPAHHQTTHPAGNLLLTFLFLFVGSRSLFHSKSVFLFVSNSSSLPKPCSCHIGLEPTTPEIHFVLVVFSDRGGRGISPISMGFQLQPPIPTGFWEGGWSRSALSDP